MNDTAQDLLDAATELFAKRGYEGTSTRAIAIAAGANLGAITYHFGSKEALYEAVFSGLATPMRPFVVEAVGTGGPPTDRIEQFVRAMFRYLREHPELPQLMVQHFAGPRALPAAGRRTMQGNIDQIAALIAEGQENGTIRPGDPRFMALSIGSQPIFFSLARQPLREGAAIDQDDPVMSQAIVDSVVEFIRAGLFNNPVES
jgi:AcrR family transcriptional regulator